MSYHVSFRAQKHYFVNKTTFYKFCV